MFFARYGYSMNCWDSYMILRCTKDTSMHVCLWPWPSFPVCTTTVSNNLQAAFASESSFMARKMVIGEQDLGLVEV